MTSPCIRRAWLVLGSLATDLEDYSKGYFCTELDLGYPTVREVVNNKPDRDGIDDRTQFFGSRAVSANITALRGAGAQIDAIGEMFAPYMVPSVRPVLHYVLDRPGAPERVMTLRAAGFTNPIVGAWERDIQLQWVAVDGAAKDPNVRTVTAWAGTVASPGRTYNLTFNRVYPAGGSANVGILNSPGDIPFQPKLRIYGPITGGVVKIQVPDGPLYQIGFLPAFVIAAGAFVDVDTASRTAYYNGDPLQNVITSLDWAHLTWPDLPVNTPNLMTITGSATSGTTQVQASWQDAYLS